MAKARFFQRESLFRPPYVEHQVGDQALRFYPVSVNMLWKMRTAVEPMADALRVIASGKNDYEKTVDQGIDEETGERRVVTHMGAVKPEIATMRETRMDASIKRALDSFFDPQFRNFIGEMIADSLRDEFTRIEAKDPVVLRQLMEGDDSAPGLDIATLGEMVAGLIKANMKVFGPFAKRIQEAMAERLGELVPGPIAHGSEARPDSLDSTEFEDNDKLESEPSSLDPHQTSRA